MSLITQGPCNLAKAKQKLTHLVLKKQIVSCHSVIRAKEQ